MTSYGKEHGKTPSELGPEVLEKVYKESIGEEIPIGVERILEALDAGSIVRQRKGFGGTQPSEIERMLKKQTRDLELRRHWHAQQRSMIDSARQNLTKKTGAIGR